MKTRESGMPDESGWSGFFAPELALEKLGLEPDSGDVVDFGCGYGTFAIPAAKIVRGSVHAAGYREEDGDGDESQSRGGGFKELASALRNDV